MIGMWGPIRFRVSDSKVLTFNNFKRTISATWNSSERIGLKPLPNFGGPELQELSLDIVLDASLGVKPAKLIKQIENLVESGQVYPLILGRKLIGKHRWACIKSSESLDIVLRKGEIYRANITLNFKEYL